MSHFTVLVIGDNPEEQLEPFNEQTEVPRYVEYTKQQLIEKGRKEIEDYKNGMYAEYLSDTEAYKEECKDRPDHFKYISEEFPKKLNWTDEEIYADQIEYEEEGNIGPNGETYSTRNPKSKWDWHQLGGRWTGFFKLKLKGKGKKGQPGIYPVEEREGYTDQAKKGDIDFEYMMQEAGIKAKQRYEYAMELFKGLPVHKSWEEIRQEFKIAEIARQKYWEQPRPNAWRERERADYNNFPLGGYEPDEFLVSESEYIQQAKDSSICTFAILKDGEWMERGKMGWFGCSTDNMDKKDWNKKLRELVLSLPDETLISIYDCHI